MGRTRMPGLISRDGIWHIDKRFRGRRLCESTGQSDLAQAQEYLTRRLEEARQASVFGVRPDRSFRQAATKYLEENQHKRSIADDALHLRQLDPYIGTLPLSSIHMGTLRPFIDARRRQGRKSKTINLALGMVRHLLNLAASEWLDEHNLTWLASVPKIKLLKVDDAHQPYPLSWDEQARFFQELPTHLARMALFKVNTGCRDQEVCGLRWEWEVEVPELGTSVFIIPGSQVKNGDERLVVLNRVAKSVIDSVRGQHAEYVFAYRGGASAPCTTRRGSRLVGARSCRTYGCMISSTRSGGGYGRRACRLRTGRTCWATAPDASPRTTPRRSCRTCWTRRIACATEGPAKLPHS